MTQFGCLAWICLYIGLTAFGLIIAVRERASLWLGPAWGVAATLAAVAGYAALLSVVDRWRRRTRPDLIGVPGWVVPAVWGSFAAATLVSIALLRRLFPG